MNACPASKLTCLNGDGQVEGVSFENVLREGDDGPEHARVAGNRNLEDVAPRVCVLAQVELDDRVARLRRQDALARQRVGTGHAQERRDVNVDDAVAAAAVGVARVDGVDVDHARRLLVRPANARHQKKKCERRPHRYPSFVRKFVSNSVEN